MASTSKRDFPRKVEEFTHDALPLWKAIDLSSRVWIADCSFEDMTKQLPVKFVQAGEAAAIARAKFVQEAGFLPPEFLRVIDCELSLQEQAIVMVDWPIEESSTTSRGYTAISHTYGQDVSHVFNCGCAAICRARVARADPMKSPCRRMHSYEEDPELQQRIIGDVLGMCGLLVTAGVRHAWHDGVCVAQHDKDEVRYFIRHIAWIYANAHDTVIFLHYIGRPMAPIAPPSYPDGLISRWQTRVWTFQEAVLSKRRRYCVRMGGSLIGPGNNFEEFGQGLASWYEADGANFTAILDEPKFFELLTDILYGLGPIDEQDTHIARRAWSNCIITWIHLLWSQLFSSSTITYGLDSCSSRESTHEGDRINSILGLAGVQGFDAHEDDRVEESTMELFKRMGKAGLAMALFTTNKLATARNGRAHTWYPTLCSQLWFTPNHFCKGEGPNFHTDYLEFGVRNEDGKLEVRGPVVCVSLQVTLLRKERESAFGEGICTAMNGCSLAALESVLHETDLRMGYFIGSGVWLAQDNPNVLLGIALRPHSYNWACYDSIAFTDAFQSIFGCSIGADNSEDQMVCSYNLIFPTQVLELDFSTDENYFYDLESLWRTKSFPAVMVRGNLQAEVEKIGCFVASPMLLNVIRQHQECFNFIQNLVIA